MSFFPKYSAFLSRTGHIINLVSHFVLWFKWSAKMGWQCW